MYRKGQFTPTKYPTPRLKEETLHRLLNGQSPTEVAKWLMVDEEVALYATMKFIRDAKKLLLANTK